MPNNKYLVALGLEYEGTNYFGFQKQKSTKQTIQGFLDKGLKKVADQKIKSFCSGRTDSGVLVPGSNAPKIITKDMIKEMKSGSVIVDVAIDQGGCVETSKPTTHANPTYVVDDVVHYCVANMPGGVPRTSTLALNAVTLPFIQNLASNGFKDALKNDKNFMNGLNIFKGAITYKAIADDLNYDYANPETLVH